MNEDMLRERRDEYLHELESLLGPRNSGYQLGTVRKGDDHKPPTIWKPNDNNTVDVFLTPFAMTGSYEWRLAQWQLAHECVHLIDPFFDPPTIFMEEGIASWFQNRKFGEFRPHSGPLYVAAESLVEPYMENGSLPKTVRQIRQDGCQINQITSDLLTKRMPALDIKIAKKMTERFPLALVPNP